MLAILVLFIALFSSAVSAEWAKCVQARLDGANAVRLLVTADEKGTVTFTIGENVITFAVFANVELRTGKLRIDKAESVVAELSNAAGSVTARCTIPIERLTARDQPFCCDEEGPTITVSVDPPPGIGGWINGMVTITITADDASGISEIIYQSPTITGNNRVVISSDKLVLSNDGRTALWPVVVPYTKYTQGGSHTIECWAIDTVGNVSERRGVELLLDFNRPLIDITVAPSADAMTVSWGVTDALSGVSECRVTLMANGIEHVLSTSATGQRTLSASEFGAGTHELHIRAVDRPGNEASYSRSVTLTAQTCSVSGQVSDSSTHQPISGVTVSIDQTGASQMTGSEGRFSFTGLDPGYYSLRFAKSGAYEPGQAIVQLDSGPLEIPVELTPVEPEEPSVSLSWTPDPADSSSEWTVGIDDLVHLYVRAPEGSTRYICYDAADNMYESQAYFLGTALDLSIYMKTLPEEAWRDPSGCDIPAREFVAMSGATVVRIQAIARMSSGSVLISEVLTLYILGTS